MAFLVPANGGSVSRLTLTADTFYDLIGPFPVDRWLDLMFVSLFVGGANTVRVGLSIGSSTRPGREAFRSGTTVVSRSTDTIDGIPAALFSFPGEGTRDFTLAIGRRIGTGPSFLHLAMQSALATSVTIVASVRVLALATETRERLGEPGEISFP